MKTEHQNGKTEPAFQAMVWDFILGKGSIGESPSYQAKTRWGRQIGRSQQKDFQAPCRSSAAVPGCGCGWRLAASSIAGRDARPTRRRDACATMFTQDYAAPTALGRIELKIPIKFSTRFGNGRKP
jgi:hypothetical protein